MKEFIAKYLIDLFRVAPLGNWAYVCHTRFLPDKYDRIFETNRRENEEIDY